MLGEFGDLSSREAGTGREIYGKQRMKADATARFTAAPWAYRGRIFCLSEEGDTYVVGTGEPYRLERVNALGELCMATPAIADDRLFIRTASRLYCLRESR